MLTVLDPVSLAAFFVFPPVVVTVWYFLSTGLMIAPRRADKSLKIRQGLKRYLWVAMICGYALEIAGVMMHRAHK